MTLWARKKDFESAFEVSNLGENVNWNVDIIERNDFVIFVVSPDKKFEMNIEGFHSTQAYSQMTACGSRDVVLDLHDNKFKIEVVRSNLPKDYDE